MHDWLSLKVEKNALIDNVNNQCAGVKLKSRWQYEHVSNLYFNEEKNWGVERSGIANNLEIPVKRGNQTWPDKWVIPRRSGLNKIVETF